MKNFNFNKIFTIIFYLLFFVLLLKNSLAYLDPDLGWHLKAGEEIANTKKVNYLNHYNYPLGENSTWVNHEWLSDFLLFSIYNNFGYFFLNIVFSLIILTAIFISHKFVIKNLIKDKRANYFILPIILLGIIACQPHFGIRVQELSVLFLAIELIIIYNFEKKSKEKQNYFKTLALLLPLIILWANMHASFLLGIFFLFFYLGTKIIEKIVYAQKNKNKLLLKYFSFFNFNKVLEKKDLKTFFIFSLSASLLSLTNPYGIKLFDFLFSYKNTSYLNIIGEWLPQYQPPFMHWQIVYISIVITALIVSFIIYKDKKETNNLWNFFIILFFIFFSIKSKRHFPLLFISSLPFLLSFFYDETKDFLKNINFNKSKTDLFIKTYLLLIFISVISFLAINIKKIDDPFEFFCKDYPCQALDFIKNDQKLLQARIFNSYAWGGYLIHQWPDKKIFIDGRLPQKEINGHSFLDEYLMFMKKEELAKKIEEYQIELFLLEKPRNRKINWIDKKIFGVKEKEKKDNELIKFLNENWLKIYDDNASLIYTKDGL